ncbi:MAG: nuclear transport factor 2 family protein [Acidobacteriota bacterium]
MRTTRLLALLGVLALGATAAGAQPPATPRPAATLTPEDYAAIYQLYARYAFALDKAVDNGQMWANLFTRDGVFVDANGTSVAGRAKLAKYVWDRATRGPFRLITYLSSIVIEPAPGGATARAYYLTMNVASGQQPTSLVPGGSFFDTLARTPEGWRFRHKVLVAPDGPAPAAPAANPSAAAPATPRPAAARAPLTAQDYADIEQLSARYAFGNDTGADNGYMLAGSFTPDGYFLATVPRALNGHKELAAASLEASAGMGPFNTRHWTWNVLIDPAPWGGATGRAYVEVTIAKGPGQTGSIDNGGSYLDTYAKTPNGWRFTQRHPVLDWRRPVVVQAPPTPPAPRP